MPRVFRIVAQFVWLAAIATGLASGSPPDARDVAAESIVYSMRFPAPDTHLAAIEARIPTGGRASLDLMLPVWSPGYYAEQDYARHVKEVAARSIGGGALTVQRDRPNHWLVATEGAPSIVITYKLLCTSRFVTGSWVDASYALINGPSTFITINEAHRQTKRPYRLRLELAPTWERSISSLDTVGDDPNHYMGPDYDVFIDSPIVAGAIGVHEFDVAGSKHYLADFGELGAWDGAKAAGTLERIVEEHRRFLGELPFKKYVFLNSFRGGAGGLEHLNSSLLSSPARPADPLPTLRWLKYVSHEYFHAINVKRLRPIELGPFDYERLPSTPSLWISEGLTTYYGDLAVVRSGVGPMDDFLAGLSGHIRAVQTSPGRRVQTLEQASLTSGTTSSSGVGGDRDRTISYYDKGPVAGLLIDAHIRRVTDDLNSLDDVMRLAIRRYSGERGFRPEEFVAAASEVAGVDLSALFHTLLATTDELDFTEALDWFGLKFEEPGLADSRRAWSLAVRPDATPAQQAHLRSFVESRRR
jgi:predicted metalloprotease with PDZ domain